MKVLGRDIGDRLDAMDRNIEGRLGSEVNRELRVVAFEGNGLSNVKWSPKAVTIELHSGVPTHALPHVLGVALQHVRQTLDGYPSVRKPAGRHPEGANLVRGALRELVLEPDAEMQLGPLGLDRSWEQEQRHEAMKELLRNPPEEWQDAESLGNAFIALQYARLEATHPRPMFEALRKRIEEVLPSAAERGELASRALKRRRWGNARACRESLINVRDELGLAEIATIE